MKKLLIALFCLIFVAVSFTACSSGNKRLPVFAFYEIEANLNEESKTMSCIQKTTFKNRSENTVKEILFHLYPNTYREGAKYTPVRSINEKAAYPNGKSYGSIQIAEVKIDGSEGMFKVGGEDENLLIIPLTKELFPSNKVTLELIYTVQIPNILHRLGYHEGRFNLGQFYPILCAFVKGAFQTHTYHSNGDPFFADMAEYQVHITTAENQTVAASSALQKRTTENGRQTLTYEKIHARDFALVVGAFKTKEASADGVKVTYYYHKDENPEESLETATRAVKTFNAVIGKTNLKTLAVVETGFLHGGMEYSGLVYISDNIKDRRDVMHVIIHETAHQWWYHMVGNDQVNDSWLDEGLTEFTTLLYYRHNPETGIIFDEIISGLQKSYLLFSEVYHSVQGELNTTMTRSLSEYRTEPEYTYMAYVKGCLLFASLEEIIGTKKFEACLKRYFKQNAYAVATPAHLITDFEKASGRKMQSFFEAWLGGKETIATV